MSLRVGGDGRVRHACGHRAGEGRPPPDSRPGVSPGGHLVGHHDLVVGVGHEQPEGLLQDVFDEMLPFRLGRDLELRLAPIAAAAVASGRALGVRLVVVLQGVDAAKVFAGVATP